MEVLYMTVMNLHCCKASGVGHFLGKCEKWHLKLKALEKDQKWAESVQRDRRLQEQNWAESKRWTL